MNQKSIIIVLSLMCVALLAISVASYVLDDKEGPVITIEEGPEYVYKEGDDTSKLLQNVSAVDSRDHDVSKSLIVENVVPLSDGKHVKVIYVAKDESNNISKITKIISYKSKIDDAESNGEAGIGSLTAEKQNQESEKAGENSNKDKKNDEPLESTGDPVIRLNTHAVTIKVGAEFNQFNYIEDAVDDKDDVWKKIHVDGKYDTKKKGQYELSYYAVDTDGNKSNVEKLVLKVE